MCSHVSHSLLEILQQCAYCSAAAARSHGRVLDICHHCSPDAGWQALVLQRQQRHLSMAVRRRLPKYGTLARHHNPLHANPHNTRDAALPVAACDHPANSSCKCGNIQAALSPVQHTSMWWSMQVSVGTGYLQPRVWSNYAWNTDGIGKVQSSPNSVAVYMHCLKTLLWR